MGMPGEVVSLASELAAEKFSTITTTIAWREGRKLRATTAALGRHHILQITRNIHK